MNDKKMTVALLKKEIEGNKKAVELCPKIVEALKKFDGKIPSKRIDTELKKIDPGLKFEIIYNSFRIWFYNSDRCVQFKGRAEYIKNETSDIVFDSVRSGTGDGICQDGVIVFDRLKEAIERRKGHLIEKIKEVEDQIDSIDSIIRRHGEILDGIQKFNDEVSYKIREYFNLGIRG